MSTRADLENLIAFILSVFLIVLILYAFKALSDETRYIVLQDATWFSTSFALIIIFLSFEGIHENDLIIILTIANLAIMIAMMAVSLVDRDFTSSNDSNDSIAKKRNTDLPDIPKNNNLDNNLDNYLDNSNNSNDNLDNPNN